MLLSEMIEDQTIATGLPLAATDLIRDFRSRYGLGRVFQLGLVVPDVEAAAASLEEMGVAPFLIAAGRASKWNELGEEKPMASKLGFSYVDDLELELLEPGIGSDFYRESLDPEGGIVVQHLGFLVPDVDAWVRRLVGDGHRLRVRGKIYRGPSRCDFAYLDTDGSEGFIVEFISHRFLGLPTRVPPPLLCNLVGTLEKLSGRRCLRL